MQWTVCVGNDACIRELKGAVHPLLPQDERLYVVGSIKSVTPAVVSSGMGWLDADAEIRAMKPDYYAVNADGDKGGKSEYCRNLGIEYLVLNCPPAPGLPPRSSTALWGFEYRAIFFFGPRKLSKKITLKKIESGQ